MFRRKHGLWFLFQVGHSYAEPLSYRNPLDVDHDDVDVGFYPGPKFVGVQNRHQGFLPPPTAPPRPFNSQVPAHVPRLLDDVNTEVEFVDVPKVSTKQVPSHEFFGQALTQRAPPFAGFESGKVPKNFPRPDISSQLDPAPRNEGGFGGSFFDTPGFEVEQNFVPGFEDIDDGSFNEVESLPRPQRLVGESPQGNFPGKWSRFTNSQND